MSTIYQTKAEALAVKQEILNKVVSGIKGNATQSNAPTVYTPEAYPNGLFETYVVRTPLTLPNSWGSIVTQEELDANYVFFDVKNGVVSKEVSLKPAEVNNNTYNLDPEQIVPSEALYNNVEETLAGDVIKRVDYKSGVDVNYREAVNWYDNTPMNDSKVDGFIYKKIDGKFYKRNFDDLISINLVKKTMVELRAISDTEILMLKMGVYKSVVLEGYFNHLDTPKSTVYSLSNSTLPDNSGNIIRVRDVVFETPIFDRIPVWLFGVLPSNAGYLNSQQIEKIDILFTPLYFEGHYTFSREYVFAGNSLLGSNREGTRLNFPDSDGIVFSRNFETEVGSPEYLKYFIKKEFKNFSVRSLGNCFNMLKSVIRAETAAYCTFENLDLKSDASLFYSSISPTENNYFNYTNIFKNILCETKDAIFENMSMAVSTCLESINDNGAKIMFKNCLLDIQMDNSNMGFSFNLEHLIYNDNVNSNYHKATFKHCNFEQIRSNLIVNINTDAVYDVKFEDCYNHYGYESVGTSLVGHPVYVYDPSYIGIKNAIVQKNYTLTDDFYPVIGYNIKLQNIRSKMEVFDDIPNPNEIMFSLDVNVASPSVLMDENKIEDFDYKLAFLDKQVIKLSAISHKTKLVNQMDGIYEPVIIDDRNVQFKTVTSDFYLTDEKIITTYNNEILMSGSIIFNTTSNYTIGKDNINKGFKGVTMLKNIGDSEVKIYFSDSHIVTLIKNHIYYFNSINNVCLDVTSNSMQKLGTFNEKPLNPEVGFQYYCTDRTTSVGGSSVGSGILIIKHPSAWIDIFGNVIS